MKNKKYVALFLAGLSLIMASNFVLAKVVVKPGPVPVPVPSPVVNPILLPGTAPVLMTSKPVGGFDYALFIIDPKKYPLAASKTQALATLTGQLSGNGISPCLVATDINFTPITCGNGLVSLGVNQMYTYTLPINIVHLPIKFAAGIKQVFASNFRSPVGLIPGDSVGHTVHVHFNKPVMQFAMNIDSGQVVAPSIDNVQFVIGTGLTQISISHSLIPGTAEWVGVQAAGGITDLDIVATGITNAFVIDQLVVVPK